MDLICVLSQPASSALYGHFLIAFGFWGFMLITPSSPRMEANSFTGFLMILSTCLVLTSLHTALHFAQELQMGDPIFYAPNAVCIIVPIHRSIETKMTPFISATRETIMILLD